MGQSHHVVWSCALLTLFVGVSNASAAEDPASSSDRPHFTVRVVDAEGKPVAGAIVSLGTHYAERPKSTGPEWDYRQQKIIADADGRVQIPNNDDTRSVLEQQCLFARHAERKISAVASVDPAAADATIVMTLQPEREIAGTLQCKELVEHGQPLQYISVGIRQGGKYVLHTRFMAAQYAIPLPPGEYELIADGQETTLARKNIEVAPGDGPLAIEPIQLSAKSFVVLEGKSAPEIPDIIAWKNDPPGTLAELRGRVVILDFWGYWCYPCCVGMPELFALHDKYHERGLTIIGIHADLRSEGEEPVDTVAQFDARLADTRRELWKDRDVPFPVAIVAAKHTPHRDGQSLALSPDAALYGVTGYPTQVLIDRRGNVVGRFRCNEEGLKRLEQLLDEK